MIFVTVGYAKQRFRRLLDGVARLAEAGALEEEVVMLVGHDDEFFSPACRILHFISHDEFSRLVQTAELVICHGGSGTLLDVISAGKVPVAMARRMKYGEHVDDHQTELVDALAAAGRVVAVSEPEELAAAIARARTLSALPRRTPPLVAMVAALVERLMRPEFPSE
jgi:UDP-N-acetylglucosamine transferase subunit ALG13